MADEKAERGRAIDLALSQIEKQFGKGSIMRLGSREGSANGGIIPTGSLSLDAALGVGGMPRGTRGRNFRPGVERQDDSGAACHCGSPEDRRDGGIHRCRACSGCCYARKLGVDVDNLLVFQPDSGEQALEIAEMLVRSGALDVCVSTPSPPWFPRRNWKVKWVIPTWVCRRGSCRRPS